MEARTEGGQQFRGNRLGRPAVGPMHRADRARHRKEENLILADRENLAADFLRRIRREEDGKGRDPVCRHRLAALDPFASAFGLCTARTRGKTYCRETEV